MSTIKFRILPNQRYPLTLQDRLRRIFHKSKLAIGAFFVVAAAVLLFIIAKSIAPADFQRGTIIRIQKDMTVSQAASLLSEKHIIRSQFMYKAYVKLLHSVGGIQAGSYLFDRPQSALRVAYRTAYGVDELQKVKVVIPEGSSSKNIASIIKKSIPLFDTKNFLIQARPEEGYLFPETYFFNPDVTPSEVISEMRGQFNDHITPYLDAIATSTHSMQEIISMASILEEEANNTTDRRTISGVLWNRIKIGMALQVDAPFYYIFGKGSSQLTLSDLATSSPYNTYKNKGLPPAAISNPGLDAIRAALYPTMSKYLFYLADKNGVTHYAVTHDEHVENKYKYLQ